MTSYDRHASHDSPYRTGQHVALNTSRHAPLTSVSTAGALSTNELASPYGDDLGSRSAADLKNWPGSPTSIQRPASPYAPGMRSSSALASSRAQSSKPADLGPASADSVNAGEIQLQNFQEGLPPPPPVPHSWKRIDRWVEDNYEELYDQLSEGATGNDVNELEHMLDISLPIEVRDSLQIHDGQERGGTPTGIIFGCMLLDCEEIVQEWQQWRKVNQNYLSPASQRQQQEIHLQPPQSKASSRTLNGVASSSSTPTPQSAFTANPNQSLWREDLQAKQDSQPPNAVLKAYAHQGWIPLARDWGGNNIAVDLSPGPTGKWGQVIIFGRDYDCKYVVARSWSAFLAMVADDLGSEKVFVDEETNELKLREFKTTSVEPGYLDILRWRMDQKYGRRQPGRKPGPHPGARISPRGSARGSPRGSPRGGSPRGSPPPGSPTPEERGRSGGRFSTTLPVLSSPLARVDEGQRTERRGSGQGSNGKLVEVPTPVREQTPVRLGESSKEEGVMAMAGSTQASEIHGLGLNGLHGGVRTTTSVVENIDLDNDGMKAIEL